MKTIQATRRARLIEYAIRDVMVHAEELERKGKRIIHLNIGDPVKFDFDTPEHIKRALTDAVKAGENWYSASEGTLELREAVCEKEKRVNGVDITPGDIVITNGVSEAIQMVLSTLVEGGDEVLVPGPCYPPYPSFTRFFEGNSIYYRTIEEEGWQPDVDDLRSKISKSTKAIVIINPNNPCGALYDEGVLREILNVAGENEIPVVSDEIYDRLVYEGRFVSSASLAKDVPVIGLNGFSKAYLMTGWRLGYVYFHDPYGRLEEVVECVKRQARIRICPNTPVQKAAVAALRGPQDHINDMVEKLRRRRDYAWKRLNEIEGLSCSKPEGAFYVFPKVHGIGLRWKDDLEFVLDVLKEAGVLLVHGSGFDPTYGFGHFRAVFLPPLGALEEALNLLEAFMKAKC